MKLTSKIFFLLLLLFFVRCSDDEQKPDLVLIESTSILKRTASELRTFLSAFSGDFPVEALQYDVELFRVKYKTNYNGSTIAASGIVALPATADAVGMVSFQHGTITANSEAPSEQPINSTSLVLFAALSSPGFIAVIPDYIGFGASSDIMHPYYVEEMTAAAVIDNLLAARDLANQKKSNFNKKLFLAGYSQGGYATMAAHKAIEEKGLPGFNLTASFPAAGGYDIKRFQEYFFTLEEYDQPYYLAYVAQAYKTTYSWPQPLSDFFQEPYASRIPSLFDKVKTASQINAQLTNSIPDLVNAELLTSIDTNPAYFFLTTAFIENSLIDWKPAIRMYMYHGDADTTVPYQNSVDVYQHFINSGASTQVLSFITLPGATHGSGVIPYLEDFVPKLIALK